MVKKTLFYLIYLVLIVCLSTAIGLSLHPLHSKTRVAKTPAGQAISKSNPTIATQPKPKSQKPATPTPKPTPAPANTGQNATTTPAPAPATASTPTTPNTLTNTGPGDVIGLFAIGFVAGSLGFARHQRKTLSRDRLNIVY